MKVKFFRCERFNELEESVNEFIADKNVHDIKHNSFPLNTEYYDGMLSATTAYDTVMIMYDEKED